MRTDGTRVGISPGGEEEADDTQSGGVIRSLAKGLRILRLFSVEKPSYSVVEIIEATGYPRATAYRLVRTLEVERYLVPNPETGKYHIGPAMIPALYSVKEPSNLVPLLHDDLLALVEEVGEHAALAIEVGGVPLVIDSASNSFNPFQLSLGAGRMDGTVSTAQGKLMLAYKSRKERELILNSPHMRRRIGAILNLDELEAELDLITKEGIAFDYEEHWVGLCGISVPVWDGSSSLAAAVSLLTASEKFTDERRLLLAAALKACAARMSAKLGATGQTVNGDVPQGDAATASATA